MYNLNLIVLGYNFKPRITPPPHHPKRHPLHCSHDKDAISGVAKDVFHFRFIIIIIIFYY